MQAYGTQKLDKEVGGFTAAYEDPRSIPKLYLILKFRKLVIICLCEICATCETSVSHISQDLFQYDQLLMNSSPVSFARV